MNTFRAIVIISFDDKLSNANPNKTEINRPVFVQSMANKHFYILIMEAGGTFFYRDANFGLFLKNVYTNIF